MGRVPDPVAEIDPFRTGGNVTAGVSLPPSGKNENGGPVLTSLRLR